MQDFPYNEGMTKLSTTAKSPRVDGRSVATEGQIELRRRALEFRKQGLHLAAIARNLGMSRQWATKLFKRAEAEGVEAAISGKKRGPSQKSSDSRKKLTEKQQEQLRRWIVDKTPWQMSLPFALWTRRGVINLVKQKFNIDLPLTTAGLYLKRWGMSPQRPMKKAIQQNPNAVKVWLEETYPAIAKRAEKENALIFWQDETAVQQDTNWVRGYAPIGKTPTIEHDRRSCYGAPVMISAVNNQGKCFFSFQKKAVNAYHFIRFLHHLVLDHKEQERKLFVICDNARIHHANLVQRYVEKHKSEIELFFLPAYSPELNPDEYLNRGLKTELRLKPAMNHDAMFNAAKTILASFKEQVTPILKCFSNRKVKYAAYTPAGA